MTCKHWCAWRAGCADGVRLHDGCQAQQLLVVYLQGVGYTQFLESGLGLFYALHEHRQPQLSQLGEQTVLEDRPSRQDAAR
jgi:hypothetical protein